MEMYDQVRHANCRLLTNSFPLLFNPLQFYTLKVKDDNGNNLDAGVLRSGLQSIVEEARRNQPGFVGLLTSDHRDNWNKAYNVLLQEDKASLDEIQGALFLLCLDESLDSNDDDVLTKTALNSLHGLGSDANGHNRWYDKALQFIVARSGEVSICNEHSFAEAVPTMNIADFVMDQLKDWSGASLPISTVTPPSVRAVLFKTDPGSLRDMSETASSTLDA